ncbi:MAG: hypothetical protein IIB00_09680 [candidate division Zixibacteria bacterium]|nr:hypothetical protein [candidate division Zixibacteria bacterium]
MMRKTRSYRVGLALATLIVALAPAKASAVEMGVLLTMPSLFNEITLLVAIIAFFGGLKVYGLVRGGLLAKCWQMFLFGFGALILVQVLRLVNTLGLVEIPELLTSLLLGCMAVLWFLGMREARKALGA